MEDLRQCVLGVSKEHRGPLARRRLGCGRRRACLQHSGPSPICSFRTIGMVPRKRLGSLSLLLCGSSAIARGAIQDTWRPTPSSRPSPALSNALGSPAIFPLVPALNAVPPASVHRGIPNTLCSTGTMVRDQRAIGRAPQPLGMLRFGWLACFGPDGRIEQRCSRRRAYQ